MAGKYTKKTGIKERKSINKAKCLRQSSSKEISL